MPHVVGDLTLQELRDFAQYQDAIKAHLQRIGQLEVEKHQVLSNIQVLQVGLEAVTNAIRSRLAIPEGVAWSVAADGSVTTE